MKKLAIHYGLPHMINYSNKAFESAEVLNSFDEIVLANPLNYLLPDRSNFFSVVNLLDKPIWIYTNATNVSITEQSYENQLIQATVQMGLQFSAIIAVFQAILQSRKKIRGFFVDCFGFDWTLQVQESRAHINRDYQNEILSYIHHELTAPSYIFSAFVNAYFVDDVFKTFYPPVYDNYPYWGGYRVSDPAPSSVIATTDRILIENPFIDPGTNKFNLARLKYVHQVIKSYRNYKFCAINEINLANYVEISDTDAKIIDENLEYVIYNYLDLMSSLGVYAAGFADINYGATSNILIDWDYKFENPYGIPDDIDIEKDEETGDIWITLRYLKHGTEKRFYFKEAVSPTYRIGSFG